MGRTHWDCPVRGKVLVQMFGKVVRPPFKNWLAERNIEFEVGQDESKYLTSEN